MMHPLVQELLRVAVGLQVYGLAWNECDVVNHEEDKLHIANMRKELKALTKIVNAMEKEG